MDIESQLVVYCEDDGEYRVYCVSMYIQRFYKTYLKSKTHKNNIRKIENL